MLGNGFYNVPQERYFKLLISYGAPKMKLYLRIVYDDASVQEIVSDRSWKVSESPVAFSVYMVEKTMMQLESSQDGCMQILIVVTGRMY